MPSITRCPECNGQLQVPDEFLGRKVKCPTCGAQFTAQAPGSAATAPPPPQQAPASSQRWSDDDEDEDDEDDEPRPRRRRRKRRSYYEPHRGTTILVLGILSLVLTCFPLGIIAWVMGNGDMRKIREGIMDPEGEGTTQAGRICGMICTILAIAGCAIYAVVIAIAVGAGGRGFR